MFYLYHIRPKKWDGYYSKGYIGITDNLVRRKQEHFSKMKVGEHSNHKLNDAFKEYGTNLKMVVISECNSRDEISAAERALRPIKNMSWNLKKGGEGVAIEDLQHVNGQADTKHRKFLKYVIIIFSMICYFSATIYIGRSVGKDYSALILLISIFSFKPFIQGVWEKHK